MAPCTIDTDCNGTLVCYLKSPWLVEQGLESKCSCGGWNAYAGEDCLALGPGAIFLAASTIFTLVLGIVGAILTAQIIIQRIRQDGQVKFSQMLFTACFLLLSFFSYIGWRVCTLLKAITPQYNTLLVTENFYPNRKDHTIRFIHAAFVAATVCCFVVSYLSISLSWVEIAQKALHFSRSGKQMARRWTILIVTLELLIILVGSIGFIVVGSTAFTLVIGAPLLLFVSLTYLYGQARLLPLLKRMVRDEDQQRIASRAALIQRIKLTTRLLLLAMFGIFVSAGAYSGLVYLPEGGWRGVSPDGQISPVIVMVELLPLFTVFGAFVMCWFLSRTLILRRTSEMKTRHTTMISNHAKQSSKETTEKKAEL